MNNTEKPPPRTEHASDIWFGDALEEHYSQPERTVLIGRLECAASIPAAPPQDEPSGEVAVGVARMSVVISIRDSWLPFTLRDRAYYAGGVVMTPGIARELARYLNEAADRAGPPGIAIPGCVPCACGSHTLQQLLIRLPKPGDGAGRLYRVACPCGLLTTWEPSEKGAVERWNSMMGTPAVAIDGAAMCMECGSCDVSMHIDNGMPRLYQVRCHCGVRGTTRTTAPDAIERWNWLMTRGS